MTPLFEQRCSNHPSREAVVRCPGCRRFFCRECVTEHEGRMVCVSCASRESEKIAGRGSMVRWVLAAGAGFLLAWLIFYYLGIALSRIPSEFFANL